ncbi:MAG: hypothetical protein JST22_18105 [Bacteroidetes bacterium]|nr:hypothetical protein [Bacteroidota bacterium]
MAGNIVIRGMICDGRMLDARVSATTVRRPHRAVAAPGTAPAAGVKNG